MATINGNNSGSINTQLEDLAQEYLGTDVDTQNEFGLLIAQADTSGEGDISRAELRVMLADPAYRSEVEDFANTHMDGNASQAFLNCLSFFAAPEAAAVESNASDELGLMNTDNLTAVLDPETAAQDVMEEQSLQKSGETQSELLGAVLNRPQDISLEEWVMMQEESAALMVVMGDTESAARIYAELAVNYLLEDQKGLSLFSEARQAFFEGDVQGALNLLEEDAVIRMKADDVDFDAAVTSFRSQIQDVDNRVWQNTVLNQIAMYWTEEMQREMAADTPSVVLANFPEQITERTELRSNALQIKLTYVAALSEVINSGECQNLKEAFAYFDQNPLTINDNTVTGQKMRSSLNGDYKYELDMSRLDDMSQASDPADRMAGLQSYTESLMLTGGAFSNFNDAPVKWGVISSNMAILENQEYNPVIKAWASQQQVKLSGEDNLTGIRAEKLQTLTQAGMKEAVLMVPAVIVSGGASVAMRAAATSGAVRYGASEVLASGLGRAAGFGVGGAAFWGVNDVTHAALVDYTSPELFTSKGLAKSYLMLGGIGLGQKIWFKAAGEALLKEGTAVAAAANTAGAFTTEWATFVGIGYFEELVNLVPANDEPLRARIAEAGITLLQLKTAMAGAKAMGISTSVLTVTTELEARCEAIRAQAKVSLENGKINQPTYDNIITAVNHIKEGMHVRTAVRAGGGGAGRTHGHNSSSVDVEAATQYNEAHLKGLHKLLLDLFNTGEMKRALKYGGYDFIVNKLPGEIGYISRPAAELLVQSKKVDGNFFAALLKERPGRSALILSLRRDYICLGNSEAFIGKLAEAIESMFTPYELSLFVKYRISGGDQLMGRWPDSGSEASQAAVAEVLVDLLAKKGMIDSRLFDVLQTERPGRSKYISDVAVNFQGAPVRSAQATAARSVVGSVPSSHSSYEKLREDLLAPEAPKQDIKHEPISLPLPENVAGYSSQAEDLLMYIRNNQWSEVQLADLHAGEQVLLRVHMSKGVSGEDPLNNPAEYQLVKLENRSGLLFFRWPDGYLAKVDNRYLRITNMYRVAPAQAEARSD